MAVYKVAQDVEADDKLLGPFTFRQFLYLIVVAAAAAIAWGLSRIFIGLAIIPLPLILFFGALALPLRKDQPMEVYLAAIVSFYLKPRRRIWEADGIDSLVEITAPKVVEVQRAKDISQHEAERRLSYLADIADSEGWSVRNTREPSVQNSMTPDVYFAASQTEDVLDDNGGVAQSFDMMINRADEQRKLEMMERMHQQVVAPVVSTPQPQSMPVEQQFAPQTQPETQPQPQYTSQPQEYIPQPPASQPQSPMTQSAIPAAPQSAHDANVTFNPYPTHIRQSVIQPLDSADQIQQPAAQVAPPPAPTPDPNITQRPLPSQMPVQPAKNTPPTTSETSISPDIINLASNTDLSIETIQREANRIQHKQEEKDDEVFISLH